MNNLNTTYSNNSAVLYIGIALVLLFGVWGFCMSKGYSGGKILFQPTKGIYAIECVK